MSWVAKRETTRIEDTAYSFMGIFNINIPMIYREREKAFIRLEEQIMKSLDDQSIFAWKVTNLSSSPELQVGLLASSSAHFEPSKDICSLGNLSRGETFASTNKKIMIKLLIQEQRRSTLHL